MSQFVGYKSFLMIVSLFIPVTITMMWWPDAVDLTRLPLALALVFVHMFVIHALSFCVSTMGFFVTKINGFTAAKNIALWVLVGELFPLDLLPEPWKSIILSLPFASGVFVPVGYLTKRHDIDLVFAGFGQCAIGFLVLSTIGWLLWRKGLRDYTGTGA
jgi:ABC-2 type transport system permease protein